MGPNAAPTMAQSSHQYLCLPGSADAFIRQAAGALSRIQNARNGDPLFLRVLTREEVYYGPALESAPDLILEWAPLPLPGRIRGIDDSGREWTEKIPANLAGLRLASNPDVVMATGPAFRETDSATTSTEERIALPDLAPLIAFLSGLPIPSGLDGRLPHEWIRTEWLDAHPVRFGPPWEEFLGKVASGYSADEEAEVLKRLRDLGYVDS